MKANVGPGADQTWTVGELAAKFDVPTNVLRHWEARGLLTPERTSSGYRRYGPDDLVRVAVIWRSKLAGMTLEQIGVLLDGDSHRRHVVLEEHLRDLEERRTALERSREMTEHALNCRAHDIATCPRFQSFVADLTGG